MLTDDDLAAIEARLAAVSEGPWSEFDGTIEGANGGAVAHVARHTSLHTVAADGEEYSGADAAFITHARTDVPALTEEVRALRACVAALEAELAARSERQARQSETAAYLHRNWEALADRWKRHAAEADQALAAERYQCTELLREVSTLRLAQTERGIDVRLREEHAACETRLAAADRQTEGLVGALQSAINRAGRAERVATDAEACVARLADAGLAACEQLREELRDEWLRGRNRAEQLAGALDGLLREGWYACDFRDEEGVACPRRGTHTLPMEAAGFFCDDHAPDGYDALAVATAIRLAEHALGHTPDHVGVPRSGWQRQPGGQVPSYSRSWPGGAHASVRLEPGPPTRWRWAHFPAGREACGQTATRATFEAAIATAEAALKGPEPF